MLDDGRGGFSDFGKYRERLTDIIWNGVVPELTAEERAEQAKAAPGGPIPQAALDEARALFEASKQAQAAQAK